MKEHRFVLVLRGGGLSGRLSETDPQVLGKPPLPVRALEPAAQKTADAVNAFASEARRLLADAAPANMVLLRGFDQLPHLPRFPEVFGLRAAAIAAYPMYRGLAKLVGMDVLKTGAGFADEVATLRQHWDAYDFFFLHYKDTDKAGEDGDFAAKVDALERLDAFVPEHGDSLDVWHDLLQHLQPLQGEVGTYAYRDARHVAAGPSQARDEALSDRIHAASVEDDRDAARRSPRPFRHYVRV